MKLSLPILSGAFLMSLLVAPAAQSQVVIFKLQFKNDGKNINYSFYDEGYVIAPAVGGTPSYVFTFRTDTGMSQYTKFVDFGEYFMATNKSKRLAVLSADSDTAVNLFALQAVGEPNIRLRVDSSGFIATVDAPMTIEGTVLSSDDESELPFDDSVGNLGYAGTSSVKGTLQRDRTDKANRELQSVAEALVDLEAELARKGFSEFILGGAGDGTTDPTDPANPTDPTNPTQPGTGQQLPDGVTLDPTTGEIVAPAVPIDGG